MEDSITTSVLGEGIWRRLSLQMRLEFIEPGYHSPGSMFRFLSALQHWANGQDSDRDSGNFVKAQSRFHKVTSLISLSPLILHLMSTKASEEESGFMNFVFTKVFVNKSCIKPRLYFCFASRAPEAIENLRRGLGRSLWPLTFKCNKGVRDLTRKRSGLIKIFEWAQARKGTSHEKLHL